MLRIFVATDMSPAADEAVLQAHERAAKRSAKLIVCHVLPVVQPSDPFFPEWNQHAEELLPQLRERAISEVLRQVTDLTGCSGDDVEVLLGEGNPGAVIVKKAEDLQADLVVLGTHSATGPGRMVLGSTAERVIRHAHCPVLLARPHAKTEKILVATDFSDPSFPAVCAAAEEAKRCRAQVTILHSIEVGLLFAGYAGFGTEGSVLPFPLGDELKKAREEIDRNLDEVLRNRGIRGEKMIAAGPPAGEIVRAAEQGDMELIVVGTVGKTGLQRLLLGSVAEEVARTASCSVLLVRLHRSASHN